ncbi:hypothetical protein WN944_019486 [Citrus x changshan-huyou]|uniref:Uncharacterized protein n=1 Tax=Citrus x changshan-huyou TaxID=2935761 RepID=A0AAP0QE21_9ROSI
MCGSRSTLGRYHHVLQQIERYHYYQKLALQRTLQFLPSDSLRFPLCLRISLYHIFLPFYILSFGAHFLRN